MTQIEFYETKLSFENDSWDVFDAISKGDDTIIIDARAKEAYEFEHIPNEFNTSFIFTKYKN